MNASLFLSPWGQKLLKKAMKPISKFKPKIETARWNIVRGDKVQVIDGPQAGQSGVVLAVLRDKYRAIIDGVNLRRRIVRRRLDGTPGKIVTRPCSIHYSNIMLLDPTTGKPTKSVRRFTETGAKIRISKSSGQPIPKPNPLKDKKPRSVVVGPKDTLESDVFKVSFDKYEEYMPFIYKKSLSTK